MGKESIFSSNYKNSPLWDYFRKYKKKIKVTYDPTPDSSAVYMGVLPGRSFSMHIGSLVYFLRLLDVLHFSLLIEYQCLSKSLNVHR